MLPSVRPYDAAMELRARMGVRRPELLAGSVAVVAASSQAAAQQQKPNILFIMGDDIGWMQPSIYHRGLMVGETPNIDRIGNEGAIFMDYVAMRVAPPVAMPSSLACIRCGPV
jgi:hypothetical protein